MVQPPATRTARMDMTVRIQEGTFLRFSGSVEFEANGEYPAR